VDDPDSVGGSGGVTGGDLVVMGSHARAGDMPAVGMSAADEGGGELGSGLTSWAPDADGYVCSGR